MRDSDRRAKLNKALLAIQSLIADESLSDRIREYVGGYSSANWDGSTHTGFSSAAPPGASTRDPARRDLDNLDTLVNKIYGAVMGYDVDGKDRIFHVDGTEDIRKRYPKQRPGTAAKGDDPGCEICALAGKWNPPLDDLTNVPDENGKPILPRRYLLCNVCATAVANLGRLPLPHEHAQAHGSGKVKVKAK